MTNFLHSSVLPHSQQAVFDYHAASGALERLIPPWEDIRVVSRTSDTLVEDSEVTLSVPLAPGIRRRWLARHSEVNNPTGFCDEQITGPFAKWKHTHSFLEQNADKTELRDAISYTLPLAPLSHLAAGWLVRSKLKATFQYRHQRTANDLKHLALFQSTPKQTVLITGASGLVGRSLQALLQVAGHTVLTLSRSAPRSKNEYQWDVQNKVLPLEAVERADAVVHLAGEGIANKRWSEKQKAKIWSSRVDGTTLLVDALQRASLRPQTLISASGIGVYGSQGDTLLNESSPAGESGFACELAKVWEAAALRAESLGVRTVLPRIGIVLSPSGGALRKMLPAFQCGVAGRLASGTQWMSWIALDDLVYALHCAIHDDRWSGPINLSAPHPVTNAQFTSTFGSVLSRPTVIPAPAFALRAALGEMADELLLASTRCAPDKLADYGFSFCFPDLESALRHLLGKTL